MIKHPRLPETKGVPRTQVFHAKTSSAPPKTGMSWSPYPTHTCHSQIYIPSVPLDSLLPISNYPGEYFPCESHLCLKRHFPSFIRVFCKYFLNTSCNEWLVRFRQKGGNNEETRQKSLRSQGDGLAWQRQAISNIVHVLRPNARRKMRPRRGMESIREREEDSGLDRKTQSKDTVEDRA